MASLQLFTNVRLPSAGTLELESVRAQLQGVAYSFVHDGVLSTTKWCLLTDSLELRSLGSKGRGMQCIPFHSPIDREQDASSGRRVSRSPLHSGQDHNAHATGMGASDSSFAQVYGSEHTQTRLSMSDGAPGCSTADKSFFNNCMYEGLSSFS